MISSHFVAVLPWVLLLQLYHLGSSINNDIVPLFASAFQTNTIFPSLQAPSSKRKLIPSSSSSPCTTIRTRKLKYSMNNAATSNNVIDIREGAPRDIASLNEWAVNIGIQTSDCFQLITSSTKSSSSGGGGGGKLEEEDVYAITNQDLSQGSPILHIPHEAILTSTKSRAELSNNDATYSAEQTLLATTSYNRLPQFYLFLKILKEYELGMDSLWYTWLNSLPRYYSNGASMTDFCYGCLPPFAAGLALEEKQQLKNFVVALQEVGDFLSLEGRGDEELTRWAFAVVHTRYMTMPNGDHCIVPMADFFNHGGTETDVDISYDDEGNCYAYSTNDIRHPNQPLRICYGDPTNPSYLLARYGFLDESSPATFCKIIVDNPSEELVMLGYDHSRMLFYKDGGISQEVWDVLLYQELGKQVSGSSSGHPDDEQQQQQQQEFYQAHVTGNEGLKQSYHETYFPQTLHVLRQHVDYLVNELDELGLGLEIQMDQGKDGIERHPRLPLLLRHNEFVRDTLENVQKNLDNMLY